MLFGIALILILACIYTVVGLWTLWLFRKDKKASENGEWRISEKKLLSMKFITTKFIATKLLRDLVISMNSMNALIWQFANYFSA